MEVEQLLSLSGSALAQAVSSLLETPGLYVFSDILELPNVREVNSHLPHAFNTFSDLTSITLTSVNVSKTQVKSESKGSVGAFTCTQVIRLTGNEFGSQIFVGFFFVVFGRGDTSVRGGD